MNTPTERTLQVILPNGVAAQRETARTYTHAVCCQENGTWRVWRWTTQPHAAMKELERAQKRIPTLTDAQLLPVTVAPKLRNPRKRAGRTIYILTFETTRYLPQNQERARTEIADMARYAHARNVIFDLEKQTVTFTFKSYRPEYVIERAVSFGWKVKTFE